jgi:hypothetical protein
LAFPEEHSNKVGPLRLDFSPEERSAIIVVSQHSRSKGNEHGEAQT